MFPDIKVIPFLQYGEAKLSPSIYIKGFNFASPYCTPNAHFHMLFNTQQCWEFADFKKIGRIYGYSMNLDSLSILSIHWFQACLHMNHLVHISVDSQVNKFQNNYLLYGLPFVLCINFPPFLNPLTWFVVCNVSTILHIAIWRHIFSCVRLLPKCQWGLFLKRIFA